MTINESRVASVGKLLVVAVLLSVGYIAGQCAQETKVQAEVRPGQPEPEHFRSGAQRSELLLKDISATLLKVDARLERMEKLATQLSLRNDRQPSPETRQR